MNSNLTQARTYCALGFGGVRLLECHAAVQSGGQHGTKGLPKGVSPKSLTGVTSRERPQLLAARRRIRELETELAIHRKAAELLKGATSPNGGSRPSRASLKHDRN